MLKYSEGARNGMMVGDSLSGLITGSVIRLYSGAVPPSPNDGIGSSDVLCVISVDDNGTGIGFEPTAVGGVLRKLTSQAWRGTNLMSGTATYFRIVDPADSDGVSTTAVRVQGSIGVGGADLNLDDVALILDAVQTIDTCFLTMPEA